MWRHSYPLSPPFGGHNAIPSVIGRKQRRTRASAHIFIAHNFLWYMWPTTHNCKHKITHKQRRNSYLNYFSVNTLVSTLTEQMKSMNNRRCELTSHFFVLLLWLPLRNQSVQRLYTTTDATLLPLAATIPTLEYWSAPRPTEWRE